MQMNPYVHDKTRELEREYLAKRVLNERPANNRKPVLAPLATRTGRVLQRLGGGLESWGNAASGHNR
jgi:hypothetical protein